MSPAAVTALVTAAAGLNTAAGDQVVVSAMQFANTNSLPTTVANTGQRLLLEHAAEVAVLVLLILGMMFFGLRAARRPHYDEIQVPGSAQMTPRVPGLDDAPRPTVELPAIALPATMEATPEPMLAQVSSYIEARPAEVARLLRSWAAEQNTELA